ncbi:MAG: hypothetical protein QOK69_07390 [Nitrososphaeraceae archaeon]|nr:hypothetical protein [Nitrososphaeraceae archaeon]
MNMKKEMSIAVIFLAAAIIFVSSTPMANNAFAQTEGEEALLQTELEDNSVQTEGKDYSGSKNYENFLNCLSDASGESGIPAGDQIVNCVAESGYIQGSSNTSNAVDTEDETENVQVSVVGDESDEDEDENEDEDEDKE